MEKLFLSRVVLTLTLGLFCFCISAQSNYCVFKMLGEPMLNGKKSIAKGSMIKQNDTLNINTDDYVMLVDEKGFLFEINDAKKYSYQEISEFRITEEMDSFTRKYLSYVWRQFISKEKAKEHIGVVYRENMHTTLKTPQDSARVYLAEIEFSWKNKENVDRSYFFLRDKETEHITKIGTSSSSLLLYVDNTILIPGREYEWSVATKPFPDLNGLEFNNLSLLTKSAFDNFLTDKAMLTRDLSKHGFSDNQIKNSLCQDYGFCYQ